MGLALATRWWMALGVVAAGAALGAAACVGDSTTPTPIDAGSDVHSGVDAAPDVVVDTGVDAGPACDTTKAFGAPEVLLGTPNVSEDGFWLSSDQRTAYASIAGNDAGAGGYDLFTLSRNTTSDPWGALTPLKLDTGAMERGAVVSGNGLELYFTRISGNYEILVSTRQSTAADFGTPSGSTLNTAQDESPTWISNDGLVLYLASNRPGGLGGYDIYRSERGNLTSPFGTPTLVPGANSNADEGSAVLTSDELEIFVSSTRAGGKGGPDIYHATRSTKSDGFGTMTAVTELNSSVNEGPVWLSADGCTLHYLTAEKFDGASGISYDVYRATRPK